MSNEETGQPTKPAPPRYIVWAWYPGGWQLCRIETDRDEAAAAYWEAKADTTGPVYLTKIKRVGLDAA